MDHAPHNTTLRIIPDVFQEKILIVEGNRILGDLVPADCRAFAKLLCKAAARIERQQKNVHKERTRGSGHEGIAQAARKLSALGAGKKDDANNGRPADSLNGSDLSAAHHAVRQGSV